MKPSSKRRRRRRSSSIRVRRHTVTIQGSTRQENILTYMNFNEISIRTTGTQSSRVNVVMRGDHHYHFGRRRFLRLIIHDSSFCVHAANYAFVTMTNTDSASQPHWTPVESMKAHRDQVEQVRSLTAKQVDQPERIQEMSFRDTNTNDSLDSAKFPCPVFDELSARDRAYLCEHGLIEYS